MHVEFDKFSGFFGGQKVGGALAILSSTFSDKNVAVCFSISCPVSLCSPFSFTIFPFPLTHFPNLYPLPLPLHLSYVLKVLLSLAGTRPPMGQAAWAKNQHDKVEFGFFPLLARLIQWIGADIGILSTNAYFIHDFLFSFV